jgi:hypothetical protein
LALFATFPPQKSALLLRQGISFFEIYYFACSMTLSSMFNENEIKEALDYVCVPRDPEDTTESVFLFRIFNVLNDLGFDSWRGLGIFLFATASRTALGPTQTSIQGVSGALSLGLKQPGRDADHSPPSSAEVKNAWSYTSTSLIRLLGVVLI